MRVVAFVACLVIFAPESSTAGTVVNRLCITSDGSPDCPWSLGRGMDIDTQFNPKFGDTSEAQQAALGAAFCTFTDAQGQKTLYPYSVIQIWSEGGGRHGSGVFEITCLTP